MEAKMSFASSVYSVWLHLNGSLPPSMSHMLNLFVTIDFAQRVLPLVPRLPFSRWLEMEADYIGLLLMSAAGYDPRLTPMVYEDFEELEEESHNEFTLACFIRTHPSGRKRAKRWLDL
ncbi:mitochondrial-like metalloendopeptidase OMA1, partial [Trifolium medium]|nr:mitochondrial-like metalloendopeptidase OMA1 [Trifolium medium]